MDQGETVSNETEEVSTTAIPTSHLSFEGALSLVKDGFRVARSGWNGKGMYIEMQVPDEHSKMQRPYIYMYPSDGKLVPWVASQTDLLANDWCIVE